MENHYRNLQYLPELLVMIITPDGKMYSVFRDSSFRDHADALDYLYNTKIKKWYKGNIKSRERSVYEHLISNKGNFVFLNTGQGIILGGILYIPNNITNEMYLEIKNFEKSLNAFKLDVIYNKEEFRLDNGQFKIDDYKEEKVYGIRK